MITLIKAINDIGVFSAYESKNTNLTKELGKVNLFYGLNTYGKSTLCDIFKDLKDDSTQRIVKRITIPNGSNQKAILNLSDGEGTVSLANNQWNNNKLKNCIAVFDSEFVYNNVFDGTDLISSRDTKEHFTDFILGDEAVKLAKNIEELKRKEREEKTTLSQLEPMSHKGQTNAQIKKYCNIKITEQENDLVEKSSLLNDELSSQVRHFV